MSESIVNWNLSNTSDDYFPLILFEDGMFEDGTYNKLKKSFPNLSDFKVTNSGQIHRTNIDLRRKGTSEHTHNVKVLRSKYPEYYKMFLYLTSDGFKKEIFSRFDKELRQKYGFKGDIDKSDVLVQICESTGGYENPFHVDSRKRMVHGLLYFGQDDIISGGELCIGKHKTFNNVKDYPQYPKLENLKEVTSFPPKDNFGLFVLSTPNSYHKGNATKGKRRFLYISLDYTGGDKIAWDCGWTKKTKPFAEGLRQQKITSSKYADIQKQISQK